jgi:hypothetical protein
MQLSHVSEHFETRQQFRVSGLPTARGCDAGRPIGRGELGPLPCNLIVGVALVFQTSGSVLRYAEGSIIRIAAAWFDIEVGNLVCDRNDLRSDDNREQLRDHVISPELAPFQAVKAFRG